MFQNELDVDETLAQLLVAEGFGALEEVAYVELAELASIEGFDDDLGQELQSRALEALERREQANREERKGLGVEDDLATMPYMTEAMWSRWARRGSRRSTIWLTSPPTNWSRRSARNRAAAPRTRPSARAQGWRAGRIWPDRRAGQ